MALRRFGVSLEDDLLSALDNFARDNGFANRSQAIRFLIEKNITEEKWQCNHLVAGTVVLMYDRTAAGISRQIDKIQQDYLDVILSSSQYYINREFILHTTTVMGEARRLTELSDKLRTIRGLKHAKLVMSRAD